MTNCPWCGKPVSNPKRTYCSDAHATKFRKNKKRRALMEQLGRFCQVCGSTDKLNVSLADQTIRCGRHHIENSLAKFNERFPSKNPAKMASILGKEEKLSRFWEKNY